jgi:transcriptional regulator with XRE-family HTH domain
MLTASELVEKWIIESNHGVAEIARRAGMSRTTIHRVRTGQSDPSTGTLKDLAIAAGVDFDILTVELADPAAASAARALLETGYPDVETQWQERLSRISSNPIEIVEAAAIMANPIRQLGAKHFTGKATVGMLTSAGISTEVDWAISGAPAMTRFENQQPIAGHSILWTIEPGIASATLSGILRETTHPAIASVTVLTATAELFFDGYTNGIGRYVSPLQTMLDAIAIGGHTATTAREEIRTW